MSGGGARRTGGRALVVIIVTAFMLVVVAGTTVVVMRDRDGTTPAPPAPTSAASDGATSAGSPGTSTSSTTEPTQSGASAAQALDRFFAAAVTLDRQLRAAAAAINATGPPWEEVTADIAGQVQAADLDPVASAIPAGLPHDLQRSVVLVFSDLTSRRYAMDSFASAGPVLPDDFVVDDEGNRIEVAHMTTPQLIEELENGHEASTRFPDDLAQARALAAAAPAVAPVAPQSRLTAEILLLVEYVRVANAGCDARGGVVITDLPTVTWQPVADVPDAEGTIDVVVAPSDGFDGDVAQTAFNADLEPDGTWNVYLLAC